LAGLVGAVLMLLTAIIWRKIVRRHASWFNFMITWIISCSSYIFLLGEPVGRTPNHILCLSQAALIFFCSDSDFCGHKRARDTCLYDNATSTDDVDALSSIVDDGSPHWSLCSNIGNAHFLSAAGTPQSVFGVSARWWDLLHFQCEIAWKSIWDRRGHYNGVLLGHRNHHIPTPAPRLGDP